MSATGLSLKTPKLRFPEFNGDWKEIKLEEVCTFKRPGTLSKADLTLDGKYEAIHYGELFTKYNETINGVLSRTNTNTGTVSKYGDILMPSSDVTPQGLARASTLLKNDVMLGGDINILRPNNNIDPIFLSYLLNHYKKKIIQVVSGTTVKHIYTSDIKKISYSIPSDLKEQQKIANFLTAVDEKITALQKKKELLKEYKTGVMQAIFSQKIRFQDENGKDYPDWEEKKLGSCLEIKHGRSQKGIELSNGKYPILATGGIIGYTNKPLYTDPSVLIGRKGTIDRPQYMDTPFWTVDTLFYSKVKSNNVAKYFYYVFQTINWRAYNEGSGVPSLSASTISRIKLDVPTGPEQQKIADFLASLDDKIDLTQRKLEQAKKIKKALLQQMFV